MTTEALGARPVPEMVIGVPCAPATGLTLSAPRELATLKVGLTGPGSDATPGRLAGATRLMGLTVSAPLALGLIKSVRGKTAAANDREKPVAATTVCSAKHQRTPFAPAGVIRATEDFSVACASQARTRAMSFVRACEGTAW